MASRTFLICADCHPASQSEMYSALVVDSAVSSCFLLDHEKGPDWMKNTLLETECCRAGGRRERELREGNRLKMRGF